MDLHNKLHHMRGKAVLVGGNTYRIDSDGVARDVAEADARKLLQRSNSPWRRYTERRPLRPDTTRPDLELSEAIAAQDQFEAQKRGEANPPPSTAREGDGAPDQDQPQPPLVQVPSEAQQNDDVTPAPAGDSGGAAAPPDPLPDGPNEGMELEDLRQMADAYEVSYSPRTAKATLVKRISEAIQAEAK
jgi:hypothetical protein